jgi:hypothetical protein
MVKEDDRTYHNEKEIFQDDAFYYPSWLILRKKRRMDFTFEITYTRHCGTYYKKKKKKFPW